MMILNTELKWSADEAMTTSQVVDVDGVAYLRVTEFDADGKVVKVTDTPADGLRASSSAGEVHRG